MINLIHMFGAHGPTKSRTNMIAFSGFLLLFFSVCFSYVFLVTSWGQKYLQSTDTPNPHFFSAKIAAVNSDTLLASSTSHHSGTITHVNILKNHPRVETYLPSNLSSSCPGAGTRGLKLKKSTKKKLRKRSNGVLECLTLDTTFESVANFVGKSAKARQEISAKRLRQSQPPLPTNSENNADKVVSDSRNIYHEDSVEADNSDSDETGPLTSKTPQWKLDTYRKHLSDLKGASLILHKGNREKWQSQEVYRAEEDDIKAFFKQMKPDFRLWSLFKLYNFLIDRSLSDKEIWWSEQDYIDLQKKCDYESDKVYLTIQIGDLIQPHLSKEHSMLSLEEKEQVRNEIVKLFKTFKQSEKSYDKKWTTGPGKQWLIELFSRNNSDETGYTSFIKYLGSESHPDEWKNSLASLAQKLEVKGWAPPSLQFTWLDLGFEVDEMEELLCMLEAYKTPNVKAAYSAAQASQLAEDKKQALLPLAYSSENMTRRFVELHRSLSNQSKKRRLMLKWISENLFSHEKIDESILNIGKYAANTPYDRVRFNILLGTHKISQKITNFACSILNWIKDHFGPKKIGTIFKKFTSKK
ncbi:hypothetical protein PGT21_023985 [Puccinia graminis f. sp. tritici]|uniref:Uncharacterized protein n=1 Tax=Puccinia graminis f. sp. tritici TaxID=56615 RepID=A0A5B0MQS9_PUCGR|nr:hypothetical protein PGT21_023985 [Puccinia graminis f. sp. tritici]KAA1078892.1 hypothetical protein PGTUg99_017054 [Puccinia graminis f. sp. tritici]